MAEPTDPRLQRAIDVIVRIQRLDKLPAGSVEGFMPHLRKDAELLLESIDGPEPDWSDVREAARKAGWTRTGNRIVSAWTVKTPDGEDDDRYGWAAVFPHHRKVQLTGPGEGDRFQRSFADLVDPTPAQVLAAIRLVGIGGDRG